MESCENPKSRFEINRDIPSETERNRSNFSASGTALIAFNDALGLPKSLNLVATNGQPIFQYQVHKSTNVLGWNFPLESYCVQYLPTGTNHWKLALTAKGKPTSIKEGTKPEIPLEVKQAAEK